jgi:transposase
LISLSRLAIHGYPESAAMKPSPSPTRPRPQVLSMFNAQAAGIDVGAQCPVVAVPPELDPEPVRTFQSVTGDWHRLADWLVACRIDTVAMASTGVSWIPLDEILAARGIRVVVANARDVKPVPGRKTDVNAAQWLQQWHAYGLLRGSFHPPGDMAAWRAYRRQRERLLDDAAAPIQHRQKALTPRNLPRHPIVSAITGKTGMGIMRAILAGTRDPQELARYREARCQAALETIACALEGNDRPEHRLAWEQAVARYDAYQERVQACDQRIEVAVAPLTPPEPPAAPLPAPRHQTRQPHARHFEVRQARHAIIGVDLTQIHGLGPYLALQRVGACGTDLSAWPTAKHFTSWLCRSPGNQISGGKVLSARTRRSHHRARALLRLAAVNVGKTDSALGACYRRLARRVGKAKAVTATARQRAVLFDNTLRYGRDDSDPGASYYEERHRERVVQYRERRAKQLGFTLEPAAVAEVS